MNEHILNILKEALELKEELKQKIAEGKDEFSEQLEELNKKIDEFKSKGGDAISVITKKAGDIKAAAELGFESENKEDADEALKMALDEFRDGIKKIKSIFD